MRLTLLPFQKRGRENRTAYTRYVVDKIAELRGLTSEEVQKRHQIMQRGCLTVTEKIKIQEVLVVEGKDDTENFAPFFMM